MTGYNQPMADKFEDRPADRRGFFRETFAGLFAPLADLVGERLLRSLPPQFQPDLAEDLPLPVLRPPGAVAGDAFRRLCDACGACRDRCTAGAIVMDPLPTIAPARTACRLCDELPCAAACPTGALERTARSAVAIGMAMWDPYSCALSSGRACAACRDACPVPGALIIHDDGGYVEIDGSRCAGCGMCEQACPAHPKAVSVEPF